MTGRGERFPTLSNEIILRRPASNPEDVGVNRPSSSREDKKQVYPVMLDHNFGPFKNIKHFAMQILPKVTLKYYST